MSWRNAQAWMLPAYPRAAQCQKYVGGKLAANNAQVALLQAAIRGQEERRDASPFLPMQRAAT